MYQVSFSFIITVITFVVLHGLVHVIPFNRLFARCFCEDFESVVSKLFNYSIIIAQTSPDTCQQACNTCLCFICYKLISVLW